MPAGLSRASAIGATYPNASNTGATITAPTPSFAVPGSGTTGTGWSFNTGTSTLTVTGTVTGLNVTGSVTISTASASLANSITSAGVTISATATGAALSGSTIGGGMAISASTVSVTGCSINGPITVAESAAVSNTLISNCSILYGGSGATEGIKLGGGSTSIPTDTTIRNCTIAGIDTSTNRLAYGIEDNYANLGSSAIPGGVLVQGCNIYNCRTSIQLTSGTVIGNYIHDPGLTGDDHVDCFLTQGNSNRATSFANGLNITGNTFLCDLSQTSAILLGSSTQSAQYMVVNGNFLAGGSYVIYGGSTTDASIRTDSGQTVTASSLTITDSNAAAADVGATITCTTGGIFAANTHIVSVSGTTYTLSQQTTGGNSGLTLQVQQNFGQRTDPGCSISGTTTLTDPSLVPGDAGAVVTGTGIPTTPPTTIGTPSSSTATLSQACTNGSGLTVGMHYSNNIQITNNRLSAVYFPNGGSAGYVSNYDQYGLGNVWSNNVIHETGAQIPS